MQSGAEPELPWNMVAAHLKEINASVKGAKQAVTKKKGARRLHASAHHRTISHPGATAPDTSTGLCIRRIRGLGV
ncbi:hypothetical protein ACFYWU_37395 [Streptomyces chrestomyceticus]|uniref:hypothetical protein n=1 Tax=Streptomyces chrestomyceticus TaxID=68185 RepID=UPI0036AC2902